MGLDVEPSMRLTPESIEPKGGQVVSFLKVTAIAGDTHETTTYTIAAKQPYIFANSNHSDPHVIEAPVRRVTVDPSDRMQTFTFRRTKEPSALKMVQVQAMVFETDATGKPLEDGGGQPLPPFLSEVFVNIQG